MSKAEQDDAVERGVLDIATILDWLVEDQVTLAAAGSTAAPALDLHFTGAAIDSRRVLPGQLFVALPGTSSHGAQHVTAALAAGASGVLLARSDLELVAPTVDRRRLLLVDDPVGAIGRLAAKLRRRLALTVVAVTGSAGKTTAKEMVADVLATGRQVHRTPGNFNNQLGLPLTLLGLTTAHEVAVVELGMNAPGEIEALCRICRPDLGVVTGIGRAHLAGLGSRAAIIDAKLELADVLGSAGQLFLPADDPELLAAARRRPPRLVTVGQAAASDLRLARLQPVEDGWQASLVGMGFDDLPVVMPVAAPRLMTNVMLALAVGNSFGVEPAAAIDAVAGFQPLPHRMQLRHAGGIQILDDCYNANPESMLAALEALESRPVSRRLAVLGDMLELGAESANAHREIGERAAAVVEELLLIGDEAGTVADAAIGAGLAAARITVAADVDELAAAVNAKLDPGDAVLVKASRGLALERVVEAIIAAAGGEEV